MSLCGGTGAAHDADERVQGFVDQVRDQVNQRANKEFPQLKALKYKSQVVAGTNYFVKADAGDGTHVHLRIHVPLPHTGNPPQLHGLQLNKAPEDEIAYFQDAQPQ